MKDGNYLKCSCKNCGGHIEFPASGEGATVKCPHCNQPTKLTLDAPSAKPPARGIHAMGILAGVGLLVAAGGAAYFFLHGRNQTAAVVATPVSMAGASTNQPSLGATNTSGAADAKAGPKRAKSATDLNVSEVKLEKTKGSSLVYAIGTITNNSDYQRFGVKVELDVFNANGKKVSTTSDYISILEPRKEWSFRALIPGSHAASAKISTVKEEE